MSDYGVKYEWDFGNVALENQIVELHDIGKREGWSDEVIADAVQNFLRSIHEELPDVVRAIHKQVLH
jgi:hypothetical protein